MTAAIEPPIVRVLPPRAYASRDEVIEAIGGEMVRASAVTSAYVAGMLKKEREANTIVTTEVALPHGTAEVRDAVLRNVLIIAPVPAGIEWAPGRLVRLAIGFAGTGDDAHLRLLSSMARVLADEQLLTRLKNADTGAALAILRER
jgi:mannitol/fructose-specific phosphotransferase system IIA component